MRGEGKANTPLGVVQLMEGADPLRTPSELERWTERGLRIVGPAWNVVIGAYQLSITPDRLLARVSSVETVVAYGAIPLGSLAGGFAVEALGGVGAIAALAGWMVVITLAATAAPSIRRAPRLLPASA